MRKVFRNKYPLLLGASAAALLAACGGSGENGTGTLQVALTDAPACGFDNVNITVSKVRVHQNAAAGEADGGWSEIVLNPARKIDLLNLTNGVLEELGQTSLPVGNYNQMRLVLTPNTGSTPLANSVVPTNGTEIALDTPSAVQSGIKLNGDFEVAEGATTELTLDFDACKSIVTRGNGSYGLKPVVRIIPMAVSGAITGYVDPAAVASGNAVVSAQVNGVVVRSTVPAADGAFSLSPLEAGTYTVVLTADTRASDIVAAVPVTPKASTVLSNIGMPLLTASSASNALSGKLLPPEAEGALTAYQTFAFGSTAEIRYQGANVTTGDYSMTLPIAAPRYGQYSSTLPLTLTTQGGVAGKYAVQATGIGYQSQSADIDVSSSPVTRDFTLVK
jgi:hypothetical protein